MGKVGVKIVEKVHCTWIMDCSINSVLVSIDYQVESLRAVGADYAGWVPKVSRLCAASEAFRRSVAPNPFVVVVLTLGLVAHLKEGHRENARH